MGFGVGQNVHVANATGDTIYVLPSPNLDWLIADVAVDIGLMLTGVGELKAAYTAIRLPKALVTIRDVARFIKIAGKFASETTDAAVKVIDGFKKVSMPIEANEFQNVMDHGFLETFFNASGYAGFLGASTVSLMIMSGDGKQVATFNTAPDDSWIATDHQVIVRSKYGSIWKEDPNAGMKNWALSSDSEADDEE